jgi:hypothetical protein
MPTSATKTVSHDPRRNRFFERFWWLFVHHPCTERIRRGVRVCAPSGERARPRSNSRTRSNECPACPRRVRSARPRAPDPAARLAAPRPATRAPRSMAPGLTGVPGLAPVGGRTAGGCGSAAPGCGVAGAGLLPQPRRLLPQPRQLLALRRRLLALRRGVADSATRIRDGASGFANSPPYKQNPPTQGGKTSPMVSLGVAGDSFGVVRAGLWMSRANVDNSKNRARTAESPRARGRNAGAGGISTGADRGVSARKL